MEERQLDAGMERNAAKRKEGGLRMVGDTWEERCQLEGKRDKTGNIAGTPHKVPGPFQDISSHSVWCRLILSGSKVKVKKSALLARLCG